MVSIRQQYLAVFTCSLLPLIVLLIRGIGWGADSFAYYAGACGLIGTENLSSSLFNSFLGFLGCDFVLISLVMFGFFCLALFALWFIGRKLFDFYGWLLPVYVCCLTPLFFLEGLRFENDLFGWCLSFVAVALFWLYLDENKLFKKALVLVLCMGISIISVLFWLPSIIILGMCVFIVDKNPLYSKIVWVGIILVVFATQFSYITHSFANPTLWVAEEIPFVGLIFILHLLHFWKKIPHPFTFYGISLLAIGILKAKYMFLVTPFLLMSVIQKEKTEGLWIKDLKIEPLIFCAIFFVGFLLMGTTLFPTQQDIQEIDSLIELSNQNGFPIYNDWGNGWLITFRGYDTNYKISPPDPDWNNLVKPYYVYSSVKKNCEKLGKKTYFCS